MIRYIAYKFAWMFFSLWFVITFVFFTMKILPGGPFDLEVELPVDVKLNLEKKYDLDKPVVNQYITYIKNIAKLDFGDSLRYRGEKVSNIIGRSFKYTAIIGFLPVVMAVFWGLILGVISASSNSVILNKIIRKFSVLGIAMPNFILAVLFVYVFGEKLGLISFGDVYSWKEYFGPIVILSIYPMSFIIKIVNVNITKILNQEYIKILHVNGVSRNKILFKYALREVMIPVITYVAPMIASVVMGSLAVEKVFEIPGLGKAFIESVISRDYYVVFGLILFYSVVYLLLIFIADIVYILVDPRLKQSIYK